MNSARRTGVLRPFPRSLQRLPAPMRAPAFVAGILSRHGIASASVFGPAQVMRRMAAVRGSTFRLRHVWLHMPLAVTLRVASAATQRQAVMQSRFTPQVRTAALSSIMRELCARASSNARVATNTTSAPASASVRSHARCRWRRSPRQHRRRPPPCRTTARWRWSPAAHQRRHRQNRRHSASQRQATSHRRRCGPATHQPRPGRSPQRAPSLSPRANWAG